MAWVKIFFVFLLAAQVESSHISCGKSFIPCEYERGLSLDQPFVSAVHPRVYGISSAHFTRQQIPEPLIKVTAHEAMREVRTFFEPVVTLRTSPLNPLYSTMKQYAQLHPLPDKARNFSEAAYVSNIMSLRLRKLGLREADIALGLDAKVLMQTELGDICPRALAEPCHNSEFRTVTGSCNNVKNPLWGASFEPFSRFSGSAYSDGIMTQREAKQQELPNARRISLELFTQPFEEHSVVNELTAFWLHFVASDIAESVSSQVSAPEGGRLPLPCCELGFIHTDCQPVRVPSNDVFYTKHAISCLPYTRSLPAPKKLCTLGPREQINVATSFLDGSSIYGSTPEQLQKLRSHENGQLLTSSFSGLTELLPLDPDNSHYCQSPTKRKCFLSGTPDVNLLPEISALHILFVRQHNRIAQTLKDLNKHWNDEKLFQETRKIVVAQIQHITFNEFLPVLIGKDNIREHNLNLKEAGYSGDYDVEIDASALNEFSTIAQVTAFSLLGGQRRKLLSERFNNPDELYYPDGVENILGHMVKDPVELPGLKLSTEFRGKFLKARLGKIGFDLAALAVQQGRDHGIPGYTQIRKQCGLQKVYTFNDLTAVFSDSGLAAKFSQIYETVDDIDLLVGALAEKPKKGSLVGPTLACVLGNQFYKTKNGDKFWYENFFAKSAFTDEQLAQIRRTTMSGLICKLAKPDTLQLSAFMQPDVFSNNPMECTSTVFPDIDLSSWKDLQSDLKLPITEQTLQKVLKIAELNLRDQSKREISNIQKNQDVFQKGDPLFAYTNMMRAKPESKHVSKVSALLLESTRILLRGDPLPDGERLPSLDLESIQKILPRIDVSTFISNYTAFLSEDGRASQEECLPRMLPCDHTSKYRTFSGWCNNLRVPEYGNAFTSLRHLMPPVYDDGFDSPRSKSVTGSLLPSARAISNAIHVDKNVSHVKFTHMIMQFGQFIDHELTHSPIHRGPNDEILNCTKCDSAETISVHCMPLRVESGDPFFPSVNPDGTPRCLPFARSLLGQLNLGYRNQLNQLTAFIDGSVIYGSTLCEANSLRLFRRGLMNFTEIDGVTLPQGNQEKDCRSLPHNPCFVAGDERNSHQPGLTMMHTFFVREHNRIATTLGGLNPHWNDEKTFQEARRIQIAQLQHIVFAEFLPKLIGWDLVHEYDLTTLKTGYYQDYDPTCDASISHPFATAAYRFGHTLVRKFFPRMDFNYKSMNTSVDLSQHFGHVGPIYDKKAGGMDTMLMGLLGTPSMAFDRHITNALRNQLFERRGAPKSGLDLISLNILRARDHGVQSYNSFRPLCGLQKARRFEDLLTEMDSEAVAALKSIYSHVDDIDLFPGITSERPKKGALLGTTMSCLLAEQFRRLKKCDRFYYENANTAARFSEGQLQEIRKMTLSKIFCANSKYIKTIQPHVFDMPDDLVNAQINCEEIPGVDFNLWKETPFCEMNGLRIDAGETRAITPCITCTCTADGIECHPRKVINCEKLLHTFTLAEIRRDTACVVQCAELFNSDKDV